jgi:3'(2'), 5'-bisphosphate nucleotidase
MPERDLLDSVCQLARDAGTAIMDVYREHELVVQYKSDDSPLTWADQRANQIIRAGLERLEPRLPILSEESAPPPWEQRSAWKRYWLVDPLDGTKEFIKRNGEFTVNVALIEDGVPVLGVVYAPVLDWLYWGARGLGAVKQDARGARAVQVAPVPAAGQPLRVVASRTHRGEQLDAWLAAAAARHSRVDRVSMGSSLKICLVAEGTADIYPRLAPTCEWDTAAAQAVLEAAGGVLADSAGRACRYNRKEDLLNPFFFAASAASLIGIA